MKAHWKQFLYLAVFTAGASFAQNQPAPEAEKNEPPVQFYRLDFTVQEVTEGKVINSRSYSTVVSTGRNSSSSIRARGNVPVALGSLQSNGKSGSIPYATTQYQHLSVGVNIDCNNIRLADGRLALTISAGVTSTPLEEPNPPQEPNRPPTIRDEIWRSDVTVPLRKPVIVFSSDDVTSKHKIQLEVSATPVQ